MIDGKHFIITRPTRTHHIEGEVVACRVVARLLRENTIDERYITFF